MYSMSTVRCHSHRKGCNGLLQCLLLAAPLLLRRTCRTKYGHRSGSCDGEEVVSPGEGVGSEEFVVVVRPAILLFLHCRNNLLIGIDGVPGCVWPKRRDELFRGPNLVDSGVRLVRQLDEWRDDDLHLPRWSFEADFCPRLIASWLAVVSRDCVWHRHLLPTRRQPQFIRIQRSGSQGRRGSFFRREHVEAVLRGRRQERFHRRSVREHPRSRLPRQSQHPWHRGQRQGGASARARRRGRRRRGATCRPHRVERLDSWPWVHVVSLSASGVLSSCLVGSEDRKGHRALSQCQVQWPVWGTNTSPQGWTNGSAGRTAWRSIYQSHARSWLPRTIRPMTRWDQANHLAFDQSKDRKYRLVRVLCLRTREVRSERRQDGASDSNRVLHAASTFLVIISGSNFETIRNWEGYPQRIPPTGTCLLSPDPFRRPILRPAEDPPRFESTSSFSSPNPSQRAPFPSCTAS